MSFSKAQQGKFRPLVAAAWNAVAENPKDKARYRAWYESELMTCVGVASTIPLDQGRDFDVAAAHFEALADDGSTYWQQRAEEGDFRRICHAVFKGAPPVIDGKRIAPDYVRGIAAQAFKLPDFPALRTLSKPRLKFVIKALAIHAKRHQR
ncbi:MAG TPA: hypothetical protein PLA50_03455 [Bacteroidia bacterium]|nr:hypothetical protein [Bacteroidia bacterium]